ncbi:hypothetical protein ACOMHN_036403 [Nucella lapillus]
MRKRAKYKFEQPLCNVDPNIFSCIDLGNSAGSSGDQVDIDFNWVDDFITSTETSEPANIGQGPSTAQQVASSVAVTIQQAAPVRQQQQPQQQQQQQLLQNVLQQQQQQTPSVGKVIMAMGQTSQQQQQQTLAVAASESSTVAAQQLLSNSQTQLLHSVGGQSMTQPFILKASNAAIQLVSPSVSQSTAGMGGAPQQYVTTASGLSSIPVSQRSSPLLNRSMTPNLTPTTTSQLSAINLLQVQQPQQLTQNYVFAASLHTQLPLSNFVANQQNLQGHAVLAAQGSNIVHTQNALIQNPNVVNVNVAHVLSNQLPQVQVIHTPQGKFYMQAPAGNQGIPQQLCLGQMAGAQMAGQPVQLATAQTMQVASNVGLAQPATVIAQPQSNVALGNTNSGVGGQHTSYNLINFAGPQGQILLQRMPTSAATTVAQAPQPLHQAPLFLRTVNGQQQLVQQPTLQSTPSTTQHVKGVKKVRNGSAPSFVVNNYAPCVMLSQQLVAQTAGTANAQNIPLQQLLSGIGGQSLRLVGPAPMAVSTSLPQAASSLPSVSSAGSTVSSTPSIVLQPMAPNQMPLLGQQVSAQAGNKSGTVTLNLAGQNLNLPIQNLSTTLQLNSSQPQPIILQQQQQQQVAVQQTVRQTSSPKVSASKKSKSKNTSAAAASSSASSSSSVIPTMSADNILSAALMSSGIFDDEEFKSLMNGSDMTDSSVVMQPEVSIAPTPPPPAPTPPPTIAKKSKKKKKPEAGGNALQQQQQQQQHVVLSSTAVRSSSSSSITITTASATTVTTTLSHSAQSAQTFMPSTSSFLTTPIVSLSVNSSGGILSGIAPAATPTPTPSSLPILSTLPTTTTSIPQPSSSTSTAAIPGRGRQGPPNVTVRGLGTVQGLSAEDKQELLTIQASLNRLREQPNKDQNSLALMQQLELKLRKIIAANSSAVTLIKQHQQQQQQLQLQLQQQQQQQQQQGQQLAEPKLGGAGTMQIRLQGPMLTTQIPADTPGTQPQAQLTAVTPQTVSAVSMPTAKVAQAILPLQPSSVQPAVQMDLKPVVGTPSNPVLHIQPKSNSKLALLSPKPEPLASQTVAADTKPVLGVGGLEIAHTTSGLSAAATTLGSTFPTGKVIMAMANPPAPAQALATAVATQHKVLRIQIGGPGATQTAAAFSKASTTTVTTTSAHQPILPSPHTMGISCSAVTTVTTSSTTTPAVSRIPSVNASSNQARPVQIKIANQLLTVQLTQQQQEKLELHLSRMTLNQQQSFLRQQQHILAKLQHRVDAHASSQASTPQTSAVAASNDLPSTSGAAIAVAAAATVIAPAPAPVDSSAAPPPPVQQGVQVMTVTSSLTTTPAQQLPATVQALVGSQSKPESGKPGTEASTTSTPSSLRGINLDIPKSSMIHSQLNRDQEHAISPDTRTPFKDNREACRRLLRYHVHQSYEPVDQITQFDENFEAYSEDLMARKTAMFSKFQLLLLKDSMQKYPTSEQVQISRMWCSEMHALRREESDLVTNDPDAFVPMPLSFLERVRSKVEKDSSEDEEEEEEEDSRPPSDEEEEEEEEKEEENKREESEEEEEEEAVERLPESGVQEEAVCVKEDSEVACELSPQGFYHSSPYHAYPAGDPEPPPIPQPPEEEEEGVWEQHPHEDRQSAWEESSEKDHVGDGSSEMDPDQFHSSFNDSFETSTPIREEDEEEEEEAEHDLTRSSTPPRETSSPVAEEQCSFQSESSRSSPPHPAEPQPPRTMVKLVIRNDGSGFTSKLLEKHRSSDTGKHRSLRSRSHSGHHERGEGREGKKAVKEAVKEEVEYIDVDNSKYSKGVSVKLERLSERTSQEYGLNIAGKACSSDHGGDAQVMSPNPAASSMTSGSRKSASKSGRKRRGGELPSFRSKVKKEVDFSTSDCDRPRDCVFGDVKEERGFYVGSAMESLDHFDSEDEEDGGRLHHGGGGGGRMMGQSVIDIKREVPAHSSRRLSAPHNSVSSLEEGVGGGGGGGRGRGLGQTRRSFEDVMDSQEMGHGVFAHPHSTASFLHAHSRGEGHHSRRAMDTSFDLDTADPQRSMVNPQVQSAIDSILNGSGSSDPYDSATHGPPRCEREGPESSSASNNHRGGPPFHRWEQEHSHHNDLDTDVRSILR